MKYKHGIIVLIIGFLITIFGAWAKILHLSFASTALTIGMFTKIFGGILIIIKLIKDKNPTLN